MFLDKIEMTVTKIDDEPCEQKARFIFWSSGKVEAWTDEHKETIERDELKGFLASIGRHYGVTADEYAYALEREKEKADRAPQK